MAKLVVFSVLIMLLAMQHSQTNALGVVRIDIQKDNSGAQFANAIGDAISSKIQSLSTILNSLIQVKFGSTGSGSSSDVSATGGANLAPLYQKVVNVNSGYAATAPSSGRVASTVSSPTYTAGQKVVTVNKSFGAIPAVSVASGSASADSTASNTIGYSYRKRYV